MIAVRQAEKHERDERIAVLASQFLGRGKGRQQRRPDKCCHQYHGRNPPAAGESDHADRGNGTPCGVPPISNLTIASALFSKTNSNGAPRAKSLVTEPHCIATPIGAKTNAVTIKQAQAGEDAKCQRHRFLTAIKLREFAFPDQLIAAPRGVASIQRLNGLAAAGIVAAGRHHDAYVRATICCANVR